MDNVQYNPLVRLRLYNPGDAARGAPRTCRTPHHSPCLLVFIALPQVLLGQHVDEIDTLDEVVADLNLKVNVRLTNGMFVGQRFYRPNFFKGCRSERNP